MPIVKRRRLTHRWKGRIPRSTADLTLTAILSPITVAAVVAAVMAGGALIGLAGPDEFIPTVFLGVTYLAPALAALYTGRAVLRWIKHSATARPSGHSSTRAIPTSPGSTPRQSSRGRPRAPGRSNGPAAGQRGSWQPGAEGRAPLDRDGLGLSAENHAQARQQEARRAEALRGRWLRQTAAAEAAVAARQDAEPSDALPPPLLRRLGSELGRAYGLLRVESTVPLEVAELAYKTAMKSAHPDLGGTEEEARQLARAIETVRAHKTRLTLPKT